MINKTFGRLTVLKRNINNYISPSKKYAMSRWDCQCVCGNKLTVVASSLKNGHTKSCGCLSKEMKGKSNITHGRTGTKTYIAWKMMRKRCNNPNDSSYKNYGARGIRYCKRWEKFENFLEDLGECPSDKSLERKNNSLGYSEKNCIWADRSTQARNRRTTIMIEYKNQKRCITEWAELTGIKYHTLRNRIINLKWPLTLAMTVGAK